LADDWTPRRGDVGARSRRGVQTDGNDTGGTDKGNGTLWRVDAEGRLVSIPPTGSSFERTGPSS
jgi:hypothetical protein